MARKLDLAALNGAEPGALLGAWRTGWWLDLRRPFTLTNCPATVGR